MDFPSIKFIPGKEIANTKLEQLEQDVKSLQTPPTLAIVQLGSRQDSTLYVDLKQKWAAIAGIRTKKIQLESFTGSHQELDYVKEELIPELNRNSHIDGIIIQAPIPGIPLGEAIKVFNTIDPSKDVDGLTATSLGRLFQIKSFIEILDGDFFVAATPMAAISCLSWVANRKFTSDSMSKDHTDKLHKLCTGKKVLIINRSNIVGKPLLAMLQALNATVTLAHSQTVNLKHLIADYDIVFTATGVRDMWQVSDFKPGQIIIDIGINNNEPGKKVAGDVNIENLSENTTEELEPIYLAGVPGGVGPLTIVELLTNTYLSHLRTQE